MQNITIGRYTGGVPGWSGYIEGNDADGARWIMYLDESGRPAHYWGQREQDGAVIGDGIALI